MAGSARKRKRSSHGEKLLINETVEVRSYEDGLLGSWHPGKIIELERKRCLVKYDNLACDDQEESLSEYLDISSSINGKIRPTPPEVDITTPLQYSMCVDAYYDDAWWEGVVFDRQEACGQRKVFFPEQGDEESISIDDLRLTQNWNEATGEWSLQGRWLFLEFIDEVKPDYVSPVSIKQMWYDLRESQEFDRVIKHWTFQGKSIWKNLILEVVNDYLKIVADEFVSSLLSDLVVYDKSICLSEFESTALLPFNVQAEESVHSEKECIYSPRSSRVNKQECPNSIAEYLKKDKRDDALTMKVKQHLLFLGWKIVPYISGGMRRTRYEQPNGKSYYSLVRVCEDMLNIVPSKYSRDVKNASLSMSSDCLNTSSSSETAEFVESENCPEAITKYLKSCRSRHAEKKKVRRILSENAKKHLLATGWKIWSKIKRERPEARFTSPEKKTYYSLRQACKAVKDAAAPESLKESSKESSEPNPKKRKVRNSPGKRVRQMKSPSTLPYNPRTILSLLIDNNIVLPRAKVNYCGKDKRVMAEGRVTRDGIKCGCCQNVVTLSVFESHARSSYHQPAANIYLEDGRSLVDCQMEVLRNGMEKLLKGGGTVNVGRKRKNMSEITNDYICSVCHFGGKLILCDGCPSSYHPSCLNLQDVPHGKWFCPSCRCAICDNNEPADNTLCCDQCERLFHASCLRDGGGVNPDSRPKVNWFCCRSCAKIFKGLQKFRRKTIPRGHENLTWTLIKPMEYETEDGLSKNQINIMAENYSKLSLALEVMHECFEPFEEPRTKRDLVEDVIFGRGSDLQRLNFTGFYTVLLEKNDELVSVATLRIYGDKLAEVPLVGTRFNFRRLGMCRILMGELEKLVQELGVERLLLPAVPSALNTWTGSFGFTKMTPSERSEFLSYVFLDFQGTFMCHKLLKEPPRDCHQEVAEVVDEREMSHVAEIEGNCSLNQGQPDTPEENDECKDPCSEDMAKPPINDEQFTTTENNPVIREVDSISACKFKGELKQYSRKKSRSIRRVPGTNCPNVEVSCR